MRDSWRTSGIELRTFVRFLETASTLCDPVNQRSNTVVEACLRGGEILPQRGGRS